MPTTFTFSSDVSQIDRDLAHHWLSDQSYWAQGRTRATQDAAIDASRNYCILDADGRQVAYARVVTDGVTFAWLCDVFVDEAARGHGLGKMLVEGIIDDLQNASTVKRIVLATSTADGLYARYGFAESPGPNRYMIKPMERN
ncbi:GNAT family N-acetyltransferase [Microbacterium sp. UFMG61]|uniref:GNAT family N-acetyltransferase n=1 Tax=Microbacterium sp. UFMG61 TaxID=2745935 RepID=UPI00188FAF93|nr:GNAT family N-acetyltransferase [Microbacterium sp. UFMG61]